MGIKNTLLDLNNHLFEEMERLNDDDLQGDALQSELARSKGMADIATRIIANANLALNAKKFMDIRENADSSLPKMLEG